ncbi:hypothetical protein BLOT_012460 [Blomia tropicalis]|nr:hypothetical protein BLOT_012460 [Blomia tropicalis]
MLGNVINSINRRPLVHMARLIYYRSISGRQFANTTIPQSTALNDESFQKRAFRYHQNFSKKNEEFQMHKNTYLTTFLLCLFEYKMFRRKWRVYSKESTENGELVVVEPGLRISNLPFYSMEYGSCTKLACMMCHNLSRFILVVITFCLKQEIPLNHLGGV